jgi:hypothetical protein
LWDVKVSAGRGLLQFRAYRHDTEIFWRLPRLTENSHRAARISTLSEELEAAAREAREEIEKLRENEGALVQDAVPKAVH